MKSKEMLIKSFESINKIFLFILIYFLLNLSAFAHRLYKPPVIFSLLLFGLYLVIKCGVMGAIAKTIEGRDVNLKYFIESIRLFFLRYLGATLILFILAILCSIPLLTFAAIIKGDMTISEFVKTRPSLLMSNLFMLLFGILVIYVYPFVFVKGKGADAFFDGTKYLFKNFRKSTTLIVMGIIKIVITTLISELALNYSYGSLQYVSLISINIFISLYIELMIFAGACYILGNE